MKYLIIILFILLGCETQYRPTTPPVVQNSEIFRPVFFTNSDTYSAGIGFLIKDKKKTLVITAHHLFGISGGFEKNHKWNEIDTLIKSTEFTSVHDTDKSFIVDSILQVPYAKMASIETMVNDIAVFYSDSLFVNTLSFSNTLPKVNDRVWLYTKVLGNDSTFLFEAVVNEINAKMMSYTFLQNNLNLMATSGSPILDRFGKVVGINVLASIDSEKVTGYANPLRAVKSKIKSAINPNETTVADYIKAHTKK